MPKKRPELAAKLDEILRLQRAILARTKALGLEEEKIETEEERELTELEKLERLEARLARAALPHPLRRITLKDIARGIVGAFFGAVAHYTFIYGLKVAELIDVRRATLLFVLSFVVGGVFLYVTGFRKIRDPKILSFMPIRLIVLYMISIVMAVLVLLLFMPGFGAVFIDSYKQVATITLIAVLGACTADIIGKS